MAYGAFLTLTTTKLYHYGMQHLQICPSLIHEILCVYFNCVVSTIIQADITFVCY